MFPLVLRINWVSPSEKEIDMCPVAGLIGSLQRRRASVECPLYLIRLVGLLDLFIERESVQCVYGTSHD